MNFQSYTQKSLEAVQSARNIALQNHNQQLEQIHLLLALLTQEEGLARQLLRKMEIPVDSVEVSSSWESARLRT